MDLLDQSLPLSSPTSTKGGVFPLTKSITIHEHMLPSLHEARPLERFAQVKSKALNIFSTLIDSLKQSEHFLSTQRRHPKIKGDLLIQLVDDNTKVVSEWVSQAAGIKDIISRRQMKIVFFGRTSNGKSTCINAMLREQVLPSGFGHTTCCFCSVVGSEEREGYMELVGPSDKGEKLPLTSVDQLVNALQDDKLDAGSIVRVHWPKEHCELLRYDVELVDSPGIDIDDYTDDWIDKHCLDADVFVLVANSESTLMRAEKRFFSTVAERLSSPNIFVLNNRWDMPAATKEAAKIRHQHIERCQEFLVKELKSVDLFTAKERIYFVSGKEAVERRTSVKQISSVDNLAVERKFEFERFELKLLECLSTSAVRTKFSKHIQKGVEVVDSLEQLMREIEQQAEDHLKALLRDQTECRESLRLMEERRLELIQVQEGEAGPLLIQARNIVCDICRRERLSLSQLADRFEQNFSSEQAEHFQTGLIDFIDNQLTQKLNNESSTQLTEFFHKVTHDITSKIIAPIDRRMSMDLLGQESVQNAQFVNFKTEMRPDCAHLLQDFKPDLEYHFILSPVRLAPFLNRIGLFSICSSVVRTLPAGFSSMIYRGPLSIPAVTIATALSITFLVQKVTSWKFILVSGGGLATLGLADWSLFNEEAKLGLLRAQL
ncbi:Mitofusin-2-like isoform X1 [Oopsacas minuta]|uniref:Mitofusin-2-like isoform X1 n=1 Tax=Oopsacas minuta TaxID=111878 RepID=A0AAV7KI07_9METZ|nr:Mitofusin-2-like isoform X1 [Oopsacas minuta]